MSCRRHNSIPPSPAFLGEDKELPSHRIGPDHHLRKALRALGGKIRRDGASVIEADHGAARRFRDHVVVDQGRARARHHRHADADEGVGITLPDITTSRRYLPQPAMIPNAGAFSITLPVTDVSAST
jgi:hypothetical protein